jgi:hypothetical protein
VALTDQRAPARASPSGIDHVQHAGGRFAMRAGLVNRPQAWLSGGVSGRIHRRDCVDDLIGAAGLVDVRVRGEVAGLGG